MISSEDINTTEDNHRTANTNPTVRLANPYLNNTQTNKHKTKNIKLNKKKKKFFYKTYITEPTTTTQNQKQKKKRPHRKLHMQPNSTLDKYYTYKTNQTDTHYVTDTTHPLTTSESEHSNKRLETNIFENITPHSDSESSRSSDDQQITLTQLQNNIPQTSIKNRANKAFRCRIRRILRRKQKPKTTEEIDAHKEERQQIKAKKRTKNKETKLRKPAKLSDQNKQCNNPWGDLSSIPPLESFRFASNDINGISYNANCSDLQCICNRMDAIGADLVCLQETKLDTQKTKVRNTITSTVKHLWQRSDVVTATSRIDTGSINKPGGTMLVSHSDMTSKITTRYNDPYGRWAAVSYSCIGGKNITVVSCYQVCEKSDSDPTKGETTAYKQQQKMLRYANKSEDPRYHFKQDLKLFVTKLQEDNHYIILMGDFNDHMHKNQESFSACIKELKLADPMTQLHNLEEEVSTYSRGPNRVDFMFVSDEVLPFVNACGYDAFNENVFSDHRLMFLDIDKKLFNSENAKQHERQQRGVNSANPSSIIKYVTASHEKAKAGKFMEKIKTIANLQEPDHQLVKALDRELGKAMKYADTKCMHRYAEPFSENILMARKKLKIYQLAISEKTTGINCEHHINQLQDELLIPLDLKLPLSQLHKQKTKASEELNKIIKTAGANRKQHLRNLLANYENEGKEAEAKRIQRIINAEELRDMHAKLRGLRKDKKKSKLRRIIIPTDPEANPKTATDWTVLDQKEVVEKTIINRNIKHFGQAKGTPFTVTPLEETVDFSASSATSDYILEGNFTDEELSDITNQVMQKLQQVDCLNTQTNMITMEEFIDKFKHWKEATYTNPARHLGHYLALIKPHGVTEEPLLSDLTTKREELLTIHLGIINYCLKFGYSLIRWKISITMMIEKDPGDPKLHRLRVMHIYETDYNLILGVKHRQLMHHMHDNNIFNDGVYSNRPGFSAQDPVFLEELQHEHCRLTRYSHIKTDVDADSCYDRIVPSFGSLNLKKYGLHPNVCLVQGKTLSEMKYNLQTGFGISLENYSNSISTPIYGTGQGSAASPITWAVILNALITCHEEKGNGALYYDINGKIAVKINVLGFVDDCSGQTTFNDMDEQVLDVLKDKMQVDAQLWRDLLYVSGGELSHIKCSYHVTHCQFTHTGEPILDTTDDLAPIQITLNDEVKTIKKLSPYKTHKIHEHVLGFACLTGLKRDVELWGDDMPCRKLALITLPHALVTSESGVTFR